MFIDAKHLPSLFEHANIYSITILLTTVRIIAHPIHVAYILVSPKITIVINKIILSYGDGDDQMIMTINMIK
jgi:hypothetical protein